MEKNVTLKDIAKATNLSVSTVSFALNGKGRISAKTRELVFQRAKQMGYRPNIFASTLSTKDTTNIVVICPKHDLYFDSVIEGILAYYSEIEKYKVKLIFKYCNGYDAQEQLKKITSCFHEAIDGILITPLSVPKIATALQHLSASGVPIVMFTNDFPQSGRLCFVGQNGNIAGTLAGELMAQRLPQNAKIVIYHTKSPIGTVRDRVESFVQSIQKNAQGFYTLKKYSFADLPYSSDDAQIDSLAREVLLKELPDAAYSNTMRGTLALGRALQQLKLSKKVITFGYDINPEMKQMLNENILDLTLFQDPFAQGFYSLMLLFRSIHSHDRLQNSVYYTRTVVMTKSNSDEVNLINEMYLK